MIDAASLPLCQGDEPPWDAPVNRLRADWLLKPTHGPRHKHWVSALSFAHSAEAAW